MSVPSHLIDKVKYYQTEEWKDIAEKCKALAGYKCNRCSSTEQLHAHHITYQRLGQELQKDLECLCAECHSKEHGGHIELVKKTKRMRGGYRMVYKSYDDAIIEVVKS